MHTNEHVPNVSILGYIHSSTLLQYIRPTKYCFLESGIEANWHLNASRTFL